MMNGDVKQKRTLIWIQAPGRKQPGCISSDAFSGFYNRLIRWNEYGTHTSTVADTVSTQTAVSSASYQGATQVTTNIYQEAPVVGEKGMRQFAQMIREQFLQIDYYGVTV